MKSRRSTYSWPSIARVAAVVLGGLALQAALPSGAAAQITPEMKPLIDDLVAANRILYRHGVVDGLGHISVRHPARADRFLLSESLAPGRVTANDIMEFDLDGKPLDQRGRSIYSERFIHAEIYKARADVNSVMHSHSPTVIPFGASQVPLRAIVNQAGFLFPDVPIFEMRKFAGSRSLLVTDATLAKALAETLGSRPVALMRGHGNVVVGPNVRRVVARAIYTEINAKLQLQAITLGGPIVYLDEGEARAGEAVRDRTETGHGIDRIWQMWVEEAMGPPKR